MAIGVSRMKITKLQLKKIINEELESVLNEESFMAPKGFTPVARIEGPEAASFVLKSGGKPGLYSTNNGYIVAVDSKRIPHLWVPMSDPSKPREVSYEQAIKSLEKAGYTEKDFHVPGSTGFPSKR